MMCSIGEGDFGDEGAVHTMPVTESLKDTLDLSQICKKCNLEKVILKLDSKEPQCRPCFFNYARHKFRASLGSTKILPRDANVLLIADGSAKSVVLLDMCRFALQLDKFRKLRFNPKILFLDEQPLMDSATSQRVLEIIKGYSFELFYQSFGSNSDPIPVTDQLNTEDFEANRQSFMEIFNSISGLTSKQDFLQQLRKNLWRSAAKSLDCEIVFIPETNIDLAKTLLTDVSLGRGCSAAHDVSFVDDRVKGVKLVRPIRDLNEKEIEHYIQLNELDFIPDIGLYGENSAPGASIQNLTNDFVRNLQKNYSSTIATVFRTGDKLAPRMNENSVQCRICHSQLDTTNSETLFATELSSYLSTHAPDLSLNRDISKEVDENQLNEKRDLCHACLSISRDTSGAKDFIFAFENC